MSHSMAPSSIGSTGLMAIICTGMVSVDTKFVEACWNPSKFALSNAFAPSNPKKINQNIPNSDL